MTNGGVIDIIELRNLCEQHKIRWTEHIVTRLLQRGISQSDVVAAVINGRIIEQYANDFPVPSCLVLGKGTDGCLLHVCCCIYIGEVRMITAYRPDANKWDTDFATRRG